MWVKCIYKLGSQTQFTCSLFSSLISKWWNNNKCAAKKCWRNTRERQKIRLKNHLNQIVGPVAKRKWLFIGDFWHSKDKNTDRTSMPFFFSEESDAKIWKIINWWGWFRFRWRWNRLLKQINNEQQTACVFFYDTLL